MSNELPAAFTLECEHGHTIKPKAMRYVRLLQDDLRTMHACWDAACHDISERDDEIERLKKERDYYYKALERISKAAPEDSSVIIGIRAALDRIGAIAREALAKFGGDMGDQKS